MTDGGPLDGLRVLELVDVRGALCGRILGDLGADVVRVAVPGAPDATVTVAGRYRNANKRQVVLDPRTDEGRRRLDALLDEADAFVENLGVNGQAALGLEPDAVAAAHPHLVHVALTDLGLCGPRASWHLEALPALAASGALFASGFRDRPPCGVPGYLAHDCASIYGAAGAVAALMDRRRHGRGQLVEVSAQEAGLAGTTPWSVVIADYLHVNPLLPAEGRRNGDGVYWVFPAADGWVRTVIGTRRQWDGFVKLLGSPDALTGDEWHKPGFRLMNADVVRLVSQERLVDRTRAQLFDEALGYGATVGVLHTPSEFVTHPQTSERGFFARTDWPGVEDAPFAQLPVTLSATPASLRRPAPEPDEDDGGFATPPEKAATWRGPAAPDASPRASSGAPAGAVGLGDRDDPDDRDNPDDHDNPDKPEDHDRLLLEGLRVVEFGVAAVVPELCAILSELGADVVKVESIVHPDVLRATGGENINRGFAFNAECRGRRSVALDLSTEEGRALAFRLCAWADVVAENYRGGVLDSLGLGYDAVRAANPSVLYVSSQGYGRSGPFGEMPAYGPLNAGFAGVHLLWNHRDVPYPCGTSLNHPDHIAGKLLAVAVLAALDHRARTGEGQRVDMAQTEAAAYLIGEAYLDAAQRGDDAVPHGNESETMAPHGVYPAAGDDEWIAIVASDDAAWLALERVAGWPHDPALADAAARLAARAEIDERLGEWTREHDASELAATLQRAGVSAMPVMGPLDHRSDPHLTERGFLVELHHPEVGVEHHVGNPIRLSLTRQRTAKSAPCLGADTEDVLTSVLGLQPSDVADLVERGVCR